MNWCRTGWLLCFFCFWLFWNTVSVSAAQEEDKSEEIQAGSILASEKEQEEENISDSYEESLIQDMELNEVQSIMDDMLKDSSFSFMETIKLMIKGDEPITRETVMNLILNVIDSELENQKGRFANILILVLISAILANFTNVFANSQISEICFYMVYLMLFALLIKNFGTLSAELSGTLQTVVSFMRALAPAYYIAITAAGGSTTATLFYQVILIIIFCVEYILLTVILPGINIYILMELINLLTKEDALTRISELLKSVLIWAMRSMLAVIVGLQVIQGLVAPAIDTLKRSLLGKTASAIPGVGNALNAVTEIVLASAVLVRNCLGVTALIVLILVSIAPIIKLTLAGFLYKFLGAVIQPIADSRIVGCLHAVGESCGLLLKLLFTTQVLFMLTIIILANTLQ